MENSAMIRAFRLLRNKPILLLLILPMQAIPLLSSAFMPDITSMLDINSMMESSGIMANQLHNMVSILASSIFSLVSLAGCFLLLPPAMELLTDGAAERDTAPGWYSRGLRKHWWKPIVESLITGAIIGIIMVCLYIVLFVVLLVMLVPIIIAGMPGMLGSIPSDGNLFSLLGNTTPIVIIVSVLLGLAIYLLLLAIQTFFALFLPALTDRGFGGAFKLLFSKKNLRKLPRLFGGLLLISFVSSLAVCTVGAVYILITGIPAGPVGPLVAITNFLKSGAGILALLLAAVIHLLQYPFRFCVYRMIKDEEQVNRG